MFSKNHFLKRTLVVAVVLLAALVLIAQTPSEAGAAFDSCRADPIVFLSNGAQVQMTASVATNAVNVERIVYTLHAPQGTSVTKVVYTGGAFTGKETLVFYADAKPGAYSTTTVVFTKIKNVPVTATATIVSANGSVSGFSGQDLTLSFGGSINGLSPNRMNRVK